MSKTHSYSVYYSTVYDKKKQETGNPAFSGAGTWIFVAFLNYFGLKMTEIITVFSISQQCTLSV